MTEQEMRDSKVPMIQTIEELTPYINRTCVYAISMEAERLLNESPDAHPDVIAHWKKLVALKANKR